VPPDAGYSIICGGTPEFYIFRKPHAFRFIEWWQLNNEKPVSADELLDYAREHGVKYVLWQNDNQNWMIAPYLERFELIENSSGSLSPLKKFDSECFKAYIYEFRGKS